MSGAQYRIMHGWLLAKVEVGGETYLCLRGVNFRNEYSSTEHARARSIRWHGPSTKLFDGSIPLNLSESSLSRAIERVFHEWPALSKAKLAGLDHNLADETSKPTKLWGTSEEAITQIAFDYGAKQKLPAVKLYPNRKLPWPRHPITWVKAKDIIELDAHAAKFFHMEFPYIVSGNHSFKMEINKNAMTQIMVASNLLLQDTVAEAFEKFFGNNIFTEGRFTNGRFYIRKNRASRYSFKRVTGLLPQKRTLRRKRLASPSPAFHY